MAGIMLILCIPCSEAPENPTTNPHNTDNCIYREEKCSHCGNGMWLGDRSEALVKSGMARAACMHCALAMGISAEDLEHMKLLSREET